MQIILISLRTLGPSVLQLFSLFSHLFFVLFFTVVCFSCRCCWCFWTPNFLSVSSFCSHEAVPPLWFGHQACVSWFFRRCWISLIVASPDSSSRGGKVGAVEGDEGRRWEIWDSGATFWHLFLAWRWDGTNCVRKVRDAEENQKLLMVRFRRIIKKSLYYWFYILKPRKHK